MPEPILLQVRYRNRTESSVGGQLKAAGVAFEYEGAKIEYDVPLRKAKYLPDFRVGNVIIEVKGWFGRQGAKERQKYLLLQDQHRHLDIRFVFTDAHKAIYKGSPTTYADWCKAYGFKFATGGVVPPEWIEELKYLGDRPAGPAKRKRRK